MNRESYNRIASAWDQARAAFVAREQDYLDRFLEGLTPPAHIVDLGCGTGRPFGEYILSRGHRLTGVDQAEHLLDIARRRSPQAEWIEARIEDFAIPASVAGLVCWDALFHIERAHHAVIARRMADALEPGGRLMLTIGGSAHPAFTDTMFGETFFYDSHPPEVAIAMLDACGFDLEVSEFMNEPTGGRDKGRFAIVARRR